MLLVDNLDIGGATHSRNLTVHDATNSVIIIEGASNGTSNSDVCR